jgi:hypothetical protein
MRDK